MVSKAILQGSMKKWVDQADLGMLFAKFGDAPLQSTWFQDEEIADYFFKRLQLLWYQASQHQRDELLSHGLWTSRNKEMT